MSKFNEGGMHFVSYHRKSKEFNGDNSYVKKNLKKILAKKLSVTNNKETLKDSTIIYDGGKRYKIINIDEIGKPTTPHRTKQRANKVKNGKTNKHHGSKTNKKKMPVKRTLKTNRSLNIIEKLPENALGNDPRLKEVFEQFGKFK